MDRTDRDPTGPPSRRFRLGLGESMLWVALAAVCSAALSVSTALAVVAALVLAPSLARTLRIVARRKALGRPIDALTWLFAALGSTFAFFWTGAVTLSGGLVGAIVAEIFEKMVSRIFGEPLPQYRLARTALILTVGVVSAVAVYFRLARATWVIRDQEVGRAPGPRSDSDPDGGIPC